MKRALRRTVGFALALVGTGFALKAVATARTYQLFGKLIARVPTAQPSVALTFDDGPVAERVDTLLAVLAHHGVKATFFLTGQELARAPEAGRRLLQAGHELGNHT